jgi:ferrochelatase
MHTMNKIGVLLVNLGTPDSPMPEDVRKYLIEFLTDERVIDSPWLKRQFLVRRIIVPRRYLDSAANYARIWTLEGSPLKIYSNKVKKLLQTSLGEDFQVEIAMRYQNPSIKETLKKFKGCSQLIIVPLFPQYASATTGSIHQRVMEELSKWLSIPEVRFINSYPTQPEMIAAFCSRAREYNLENYDHFVFSFHGLPESQIRKSDDHDYCLKERDCCSNICAKNKNCYSAQCHATTKAIAEQLGIGRELYTICFQSRLGKEPWLRPYASDVIEELAHQGKKNVLVFSPAFVCDCLETIDEIGREYRKEFTQRGGERFDLVQGLNDHPLWIEALRNLVTQSDKIVPVPLNVSAP